MTVATRVSSPPSTISREVLSKETDVTGIIFAFTVTSHFAVFPPSVVVTVIVAVPAFKAVTLPLATDATLESLLLHVTDLSVALSGLTVAVKVSSSPSVNSAVVLSRDTDVTPTNLAFTVTSHEAVLPPSVVVTVMVAVPAFRAVTLPLATDATLASLDVHDTDLSVALSGLTVATRVSSPPSTISREVLSRETEVTGIILSLTVISHPAVLPPSSVDTLMITVPALTAVTLPSVTVATAVLLLLHITFLFVASSGVTVAVRVNSSPTSISATVLSRLTPVTAMTSVSTVTSHDAVLPPSSVVTVTVVLPTANPVIFPAVTVATFVSELFQTTALLSAFAGETVATSVTDSPILRSTTSLSRFTFSTETTFRTTSTSQVSVMLPSSLLALTVVLPTPTADTRPVSSTLAIALLPVCQLTFLFVASSGDTVADSWNVSPSSSLIEVVFNVMSVTKTSHGSFLHESTAIATTAGNSTIKSLLRFFMYLFNYPPH